jgi:VWFA-related protein
MRLRPLWLSALAVLLAAGWLGVSSLRSPAYPAGPQQPAAQAPAGSIRAESNLVLVDAIVTDKKNNYIRDLESKDFRVYEDDKEQPITSFSRDSDMNAPNAPEQKRYLVLFFDNSTMDASDQMRARQAAAQFIEKTASSDRLMAVVDFGGTLRIVQNFTADASLLKDAVHGVKFAHVNPNQAPEVASLGGFSLTSLGADFGAQTFLLAIRALSKKLRAVPGRKTLILFSSGFALTPQRQSELTATIDAANKANVAIYPVDVRGLMAPGEVTPGVTNPSQPGLPQQISPAGTPGGPAAALDNTMFPHEDLLLAALLWPPLPQRPGGGGGAGGGGGGGTAGGGRGAGGAGGGAGGGTGTSGGGRGGTAGSSGGAGGGRSGGGSTGGGGTRGGGTTGGGRGGGGGGGGNLTNRFTNQPLIQRQIIPQFPESATTNQQVLYALASGTGGFPIFNTNDFLAGLERIAHELNEYYVLGYVPPRPTHDGSYHKIQVKVEQKGLVVRARNGYYDMRGSGSDLLAGDPVEKTLEARVASPQPGNVTMSLEAPYFYTAANLARVNLAMEIPGDALNFEKEKGKYHAELNLLGVAYRDDGTVAARFSDTGKLDMDKKEQKELSKGNYPYQNSFDIAPGKYKLKVVLSTGADSFAKIEKPLEIEPYNGKQFGLSGVALSNEYYSISDLGTHLDQALLEERKPLVSQNRQFLPSGSNRFSRDQGVALYVEVYEPLLLSDSTLRVGIIYNVVDKKTNQQVYTSNTILVNQFAQTGNLVIPIAVPLHSDQIKCGDCRIDVIARDGAGNASPVHSVDFTIN